MDISDQTYKFYDQIAEDFSRTRQRPWPGWEKLLPHLPLTDFTILDIACGNGRFYAFLEETHKRALYTGIDKSKILLQIAKKTYPNTSFFEIDAISELSKVEGKFDVITIFGFMHHIPENINKNDYFSEIIKKLNKNGILAFSIWHLEKDKRFEKRAKKVENTENDYLYDWGSTVKQTRYFHLYSEDEVNNLIKELETLGCKLIDRFESDGKSENLNEYLIFKLF